MFGELLCDGKHGTSPGHRRAAGVGAHGLLCTVGMPGYVLQNPAGAGGRVE